MEPQPKYREKVLIGLESAPPSFDVRNKVMGPGGANLQYITNETGAIVTLRGKGSGYVEANGHESIEPLHICVEHSKYEVLQAGRQLAFNLIETVQQEWSNIQQQQQAQQQQAQQQQQSVGQQPPPAQQHQGQAQVSSQQSDNQPQPSIQQHIQSIPNHLHAQGGSTAGSNSGPTVNSSEMVQPALQLPIQLFQPPPSLSLPPPPPIQLAQPPIQVNVAGGGGSGGQQTGGTSTGSGGSEGSATTAIVQTQATPGEIPHQIQIQPQQVFVAGSGGGVIQPATILPQQQLQPTPSILHQPQIITQASYPIQASNGQVVMAYPNIVRPVGADSSATQHPQVMLLQYTPQRPIIQSRAGTGQSQTIPQIVQIVNPQTGQVQHLVQHIQPQIQMQQLALGGGAGQMGGQVLMPLNQAGQQAQAQQQLVQATQPIQFTTLPAAHNQGMIITSHPHQVTVSQSGLQQQPGERSSPQVVQSQQTSTSQVIGQVRPGQGIKRRFESAPSSQLPPNYQTVPPPQPVPPPTMTLHSIRKGVGSEQQVQIQQAIRQHQLMQQQHQQQQQIQQQQQHQQQQLHHQIQQQIQQQQQQIQQQQIQQHQMQQQQQLQQQQVQIGTQVVTPHLEEIQQAPEEKQQQVGQSDDCLKPEQQPKRGRPATISGVVADVRKVEDGSSKSSYNSGPQQYQVQQTQGQQQEQGGPAQGKQQSGQQVYSQEQYPGYPPPSYPPLYQQPPPHPPPTFHPYNSWIMPQ